VGNGLRTEPYLPGVTQYVHPIKSFIQMDKIMPSDRHQQQACDIPFAPLI
jgi:hypothetical protein